LAEGSDRPFLRRAEGPEPRHGEGVPRIGYARTVHCLKSTTRRWRPFGEGGIVGIKVWHCGNTPVKKRARFVFCEVYFS
jgi:hypothetical protein